MNTTPRVPAPGAFAAVTALTPLPDAVAARRSGPPRDFNCFCVFCTKAADTSNTRPPRSAEHRSR
ncbi:hypothetical protein AB0M92_24110 [Streptomyces sp. NPDC051582]|uniref:hypothetical protein n=1 Tax=Streptomyces sp. NPDC051582 TaxID=3155167 RepID=UPI0034378DAB